MTTQEAATALGVHRSRVLRLINDGRLKAEKRGRDWWIEPEALEAVRHRKNGRPTTKANPA